MDILNERGVLTLIGYTQISPTHFNELNFKENIFSLIKFDYFLSSCHVTFNGFKWSNI